MGLVDVGAPGSDQVEINLFGPGFGECILLHVGSNRWIVIDSRIRRESTNPVALEYLSAIGVDAAAAVQLIVATHWHDDHVRGLSALVDAALRRVGRGRILDRRGRRR
jgi:glyoxylase-like metal-dependent hydrolase (beta-lactamase superfamily II)